MRVLKVRGTELRKGDILLKLGGAECRWVVIADPEVYGLETHPSVSVHVRDEATGFTRTFPPLIGNDVYDVERGHPAKPRLIINAGEIRDIMRHLKEDKPFPMRLADGTDIEVVAGEPQSGKIGREFADLDEIEVRGTSL